MRRISTLFAAAALLPFLAPASVAHAQPVSPESPAGDNRDENSPRTIVAYKITTAFILIDEYRRTGRCTEWAEQIGWLENDLAFLRRVLAGNENADFDQDDIDEIARALASARSRPCVPAPDDTAGTPAGEDGAGPALPPVESGLPADAPLADRVAEARERFRQNLYTEDPDLAAAQAWLGKLRELEREALRQRDINLGLGETAPVGPIEAHLRYVALREGLTYLEDDLAEAKTRAAANAPPVIQPPSDLSAVDFVDEVKGEVEAGPDGASHSAHDNCPMCNGRTPPDPDARAPLRLGPDAPLRDRLSEAYQYFEYALMGEGRYSAQAWLNTLRDLAEEAGRQARGARAFGNLSTVDPEAARQLSDAAQNLLHDAEQEFDESMAPPPGAPATPDGDQSAAPPAEFEHELAGPIVGSRISFFAEAGEYRPPETGIGVQREGPPGTAPETFAGTTRGKITTYGGGGVLTLPRLTIGFSYQEGDATNDFAIPAGPGIDSGIVYGTLSPGGSSGIIAPFGLTGETDVDYEAFTAFASRRLANRWMLNEPGGAEGPVAGYDLSLFGNYTRVDRNYSATAAAAGVSGGFPFQFSQERMQELDESFFETGLRGSLSVPIAPGLAAHLNASSGLYYRSTDFNSVEHNMSNFGPLEDRDFTIEIRQSDNGFGFHGSLGAGLSVAVGDNLSLGVGGAIEYRSDIGAIFNPSSGDQVFFDGLATELTTRHIWSKRIRIGVRLRF